MPTQPRTGSSRTKKTPAPAAQEPSSDTRSTDIGVTATQLERREIPSFSENREQRIAEAAYWRAERRGFGAGQELDDWLAAEREVDEDDASRQRRRDQE